MSGGNEGGEWRDAVIAITVTAAFYFGFMLAFMKVAG